MRGVGRKFGLDEHMASRLEEGVELARPDAPAGVDVDDVAGVRRRERRAQTVEDVISCRRSAKDQLGAVYARLTT
jgi:hypothetical protein